MKKLIAFVLSLCVLGGAAPTVTHYAPDMAIVASAASSGTCGENLAWAVDDTGTLTISGTGSMNDWRWYSIIFSHGGPAQVEFVEDAAPPWYDLNGEITKIVVEEGVEIISYSAFLNLYNVTSVELPSSLTAIGSYAFGNCNSLKEIVIPDSVTSIGSDAFAKCYNLTSINIPDSVTIIGSDAFAECYNLTSINIPDSVTSISNFAFYHCSSLTSINIPGSVTSIGYRAFGYCSNLKSINIPDSVTSIDDSAFLCCSNLESITIQNPDCDIYNNMRTINSGYDAIADESYFNGTIYGYSGSTAQTYAEKYGYNFESLDEAPAEPLLGDVDGNEIVDGRDASMVLTHYALISANKPGVITDAQALLNADWDQNDIIDGRDASAILTYYAEQSVSKE